MTDRRSPRNRFVLVPLPALLLLLAAGGCEINSPEMPSFETTFVVPLGSETLSIMDAVDSEDFLQIADDGSLGFHLEGEPDTLQLDFDLSVAIPAETIDQGLGDFSLPAAAPLGYAFTLGELWPPAAGAGGVTTVVPPFPFDVTSAGQDLPDIQSATVSAGLLEVTVTNGLPVPVGAAGGPDQIVLRLEDPADGSLLVQLVFPPVGPGEAAIVAADLAGVTLPDGIAVRLAGGSPGSGGQLVTVDGSDSIAVEAAFVGLVVSSATAVIEAQTFTTGFASALPDDYEISRAVIADGTIDLALQNNMPIPCTAAVTWAEVRSIDGAPLTRSFALAAGGTAAATIDLSGHTVQADGLPLTGLAATVVIDTPGSGGVAVSLSAGDGLGASLSGGTLGFSSITGLVPAYTVPLDPIAADIDLPDEMDGLALTAATLVLRLTNSAGVAADVDLTLAGTAADGTVRSLDVAERILPAIGRAASVTTITLDETNSGILDFLNNLPENVTLGGAIVAGGAGDTGTVHANDFAVVGWEISAPVEVVLTGASLDGEPTALDLDADLRNRIASHARGAVLRTEISNHLPLAVELRIVADTDTSNLSVAPMLVIGPVPVAAGLVDAASHIVTAPVTSTPTITLSESQARLFGLAGLHTRVEAYLPSTDGQPVRLMSTDYLEFRGVVELEVLIDDEL